MPVRLSLTAGTVGDCTQASDLIAGLAAAVGRAYDTDAIVAEALAQGEPVIPQGPPGYDHTGHLVDAVLDFKQWRGVATRYAKNGFPPGYLSN